MGIEPFSFYEMTIQEINLAYEGYLSKMELFGNVMLMAIRQQNKKKAKPIHLKDKQQDGKSDASVKKSTLDKREETFKALGII